MKEAFPKGKRLTLRIKYNSLGPTTNSQRQEAEGFEYGRESAMLNVRYMRTGISVPCNVPPTLVGNWARIGGRCVSLGKENRIAMDGRGHGMGGSSREVEGRGDKGGIWRETAKFKGLLKVV